VYIDFEDFFVNRLIMLREQKGISARNMSLSIGQNANYINQIESKKALPSMQNFFYICDFLNVTPEEFFATNNKKPEKLNAITENIQLLNEDEFSNLYNFIEAIVKSHYNE
jgi:transcriptional regulator with XRE-family HTH domain